MSRASSMDIDKRTPLRAAALIVGVIFLVVGVLGFIPGITTDYDEMDFAGHDSEAELLGIFQVSVLHNLVHLAFGVLGVLMAKTSALARLYLIAAGAVYLVLWLYGLIVDDDEDGNFIPLNDADGWLHLSLGVVMVALGLLLPRDRSRR